MEIKKIFFPKLLKEDDTIYLENIFNIIKNIDEYCYIQVTKNLKKYSFRLAPSSTTFINLLVEEIIKYNNTYNIKVDFSKSIKTALVVSFNVTI